RRRPWRLLLHASEEGAIIDAAEGTTDRSGRWRSPSLPAGIYVVRVLEGDNSFFWQEVTLSESTQELAIELPLVEVVGTVRFGEEPLAGRLLFGGQNGRGGTKIGAESDTEGHFSAVLPRADKWVVDVQSDDPPVDAVGLGVEVRRRRDRRPTKLDIEIPDTVVRGTVSDDQGRPVPDAWVHLTRFEPSSGLTTRTTGRDGAFTIQGQLPGRCFVWARTANGETSDTSEVVLVEGPPPPPLQLVVEKRRLLRGRVTSAAGTGVAGAQVFADAFPAAGLPTLPGWDRAAADLDGAFKLELPNKTAEVQLVVLAPGHPLAAWRVRLREETTALTLRLEESQGTLHLPRTDSNLVTSLFPLLLLDGEPLGGDLLRSWAMAGNGGSPSGDIKTVSGMPPGSYRYCELEPQEALLVLWGAAAPSESACTEGYLAAGGELTLESPRATAAANRRPKP
ncbi:MAG: carboxypeptidase-like regulatory domain-containing protein, partial [Anaerolineales bacterium]